MTAIEGTAREATTLLSAGGGSTTEQQTHSQIEFVGVPVRGFTLAHSREPGSAPSRLNAYDIREFAVTDAMPQKNWATAQMSSRNSPVCRPAASMKICAGGSPVSLCRAPS